MANYSNGCPECGDMAKLVCFGDGEKWCCTNHVCGWQEGQTQNNLDKVRKHVDALTQDELRTLRAIINGKLSKRVITPEQQAKMQAARQKVI